MSMKKGGSEDKSFLSSVSSVSSHSSKSSSLSSSRRRGGSRIEDDLLHAGGISMYLNAAAIYPPKQENDGCNLLDIVVLQPPRVARGEMILTTHVNLAHTLPPHAKQERRELLEMFNLPLPQKASKKKKATMTKEKKHGYEEDEKKKEAEDGENGNVEEEKDTSNSSFTPRGTTTSRSVTSSTRSATVTTTNSQSPFSLEETRLSDILIDSKEDASVRRMLTGSWLFLGQNVVGSRRSSSVGENDVSLKVANSHWEGKKFADEETDEDHLERMRHIRPETIPITKRNQPTPPWQKLIDRVLRNHLEYFILETRLKYHYRWDSSMNSSWRQKQQQERLLLGVITRRCWGELKIKRHAEGDQVDSLGTGVMGVHLLVFPVQIVAKPQGSIRGVSRGSRRSSKDGLTFDEEENEESVDDTELSFAESLGVETHLSPEPFPVRTGDEDELMTARIWTTSTSSFSSQGGRDGRPFRMGRFLFGGGRRQVQQLQQETTTTLSSWPVFLSGGVGGDSGSADEKLNRLSSLPESATG